MAEGLIAESGLKMEVISFCQSSRLGHWCYDRWSFYILFQKCEGWWQSSTGARGQERFSKGELTLLSQLPVAGVVDGGEFWTQMKFSGWDNSQYFNCVFLKICMITSSSWFLSLWQNGAVGNHPLAWLSLPGPPPGGHRSGRETRFTSLLPFPTLLC